MCECDVTYHQAYAYVKRKRSIAKPADGFEAFLCSDEFKQLLKAYQTEILPPETQAAPSQSNALLFGLSVLGAGLACLVVGLCIASTWQALLIAGLAGALAGFASGYCLNRCGLFTSGEQSADPDIHHAGRFTTRAT